MSYAHQITANPALLNQDELLIFVVSDCVDSYRLIACFHLPQTLQKSAYITSHNRYFSFIASIIYLSQIKVNCPQCGVNKVVQTWAELEKMSFIDSLHFRQWLSLHLRKIKQHSNLRCFVQSTPIKSQISFYRNVKKS